MDQGRLATGGKLGRYEILEHVASGGMAEVYLCRRSGIGGFQRQVILKIVRASFSENDEYARMFLDEARIAGAVNHPNIAAVYEAEEVDGVAFLVMEYVPGPTLSRLIRFSEQLDRPNRVAVASLIAGAARGLHHVHTSTAGTGRGAGLIHRDVSLDNILASRDGLAKVVDFGIALANERLTQTEGDVVKGKLAYVSPEQLANDDVDYRADIFGLGVCLYRATLGVPPYADTNPHALLKARLTNTFRRPRDVDPEFPEALERIIVTALSAEPTERQASAGQFANEVEAWIRSAQPSFDTSDVAAWIASCFRSEADWRARPTGRSSPSAASLAGGRASEERGDTTAIRPPVGGDPTSVGLQRHLKHPQTWALTATSAVLVGLGILALINAALQILHTAPPFDRAEVASVVEPPAAPVPAALPIPPAPAPDAVELQPASLAIPAQPAATPTRPEAKPAAPAAPTTPKSLSHADAQTVAEKSLKSQGWTIAARDWKSGVSALDIIATRGASVRFVDVRVVEADTADTADSDVPQNRRRLRAASDAWQSQNPGHKDALLQVAAVSPGAPDSKIRWIAITP